MFDFKRLFTPSSPELAKKDRKAMADTFKVSIDTLERMRRWGYYKSESVANSGKILAKELMDIELETKDVLDDQSDGIENAPDTEQPDEIESDTDKEETDA